MSAAKISSPQISTAGLVSLDRCFLLHMRMGVSMTPVEDRIGMMPKKSMSPNFVESVLFRGRIPSPRSHFQ